MITIATYKNTPLQSIAFPANAAVLVRERQTLAGVDIIEFLAVDGVKDTKPVTLVKHLLLTMLADFKWRTDFEADFKVVRDNNGKTLVEQSGVRAKNLFTKFLSVSTLCKTDSEGHISLALQCDQGVTFRNTALNVNKNQAIAMAKDKNILRACVHNQAKAIVAQCSQFTDIARIADALEKAMDETEVKTATKRATKKAETKTETKVA